jgi:hypothetical protein
MGRLINAKLAAARDGNIRDLSPILVLYFSTGYIVPSHLLNKHLDIVTDEKEFLLIVLIGWMHGELSRRQTENEPTFARVNMGKFEDIPQKGTIRLRIFAVDNSVCANNHSIYQMYGTRR